MSWDSHYALLALPVLARGLWITIVATVLSFALAAVLGLLIVLAEMIPSRTVRTLVRGSEHFIRGTPLLVQLFFLYYVLPYLDVTLPALGCGIFGLGVHYAAYLSQVYRAGIAGVPPLQWEAARACNLTRTQTWVHIVLPQALKPSFPVMGNYLIALLKETPILSSITIMDMMGEANTFGDLHYRYLEPVTLVGILFLSIGLLARWVTGTVYRLLSNPV
ncbi:ectoine/hydroxyectoine ABC transporter permease subunit EhuD [Gluconacetobacter azotocaptans]|uniref:Ectoine/hydroxyectoine ABC transporter permease subunit EhuD n=1 Tax=Gluconacetobacter azotocaptans TaxID=142834 RepID=A0A7W4JQL8_9PROT|nr:ectoine/hydroxyectoine ABC transporter permease subunit EhuD [Gluconacetobacter azotocaptans]MBB2188915.1 ectoine/hydroxyectoine ABC transporter permease subunit EhuD [Gluconacetobacter azotocaptans]MBM9401513.1 ectoine/hydroxyectoine ABC transporter permease subunit EhuD [Gluconacetobacter azotocaptans]GBQ26022.1 amino acid ABC transporter permease [Gluconacetobacter azotocaptans DSM 13594]